jgi:hypothetical protein
VDLLDSINILLKRWWLTLPLFALTLIGVASAAVVLPWSYEAKADMVFLASSYQAKQAGGNPWLVFDGSLTVTAEVVGRELMDDQTMAAIRNQGLTSTYLIGVAPNSAGPVLDVDVKGNDSADTAATLNALMKLIPQKLDQIQAEHGVAAPARIRLNVVSASPHPDLKSTSKVRTLAVLAFGGLVATVAVPLFVESISARRTGGRRSEPQPRPGSGQGRGAPPARERRRTAPRPEETSLPDEQETTPADLTSWSQQDPVNGRERPVSANGSAGTPAEPETTIEPAGLDDYWPFHPGSSRTSRATETDV